jgi:hypothetical protein
MDHGIAGSQDFDGARAVTIIQNIKVSPQVRERLSIRSYEGVAIETADTLVHTSHGVILHSA